LKKRFSFHKDELLPIEKALAKRLKECSCYWGDIDPCHECAELKPIYDKIKAVVDIVLKRRKDSSA